MWGTLWRFASAFTRQLFPEISPQTLMEAFFEFGWKGMGEKRSTPKQMFDNPFIRRSAAKHVNVERWDPTSMGMDCLEILTGIEC
ncbi:8700_t:CDS:2 [Paraglomus occultum]|uniref:8700_t:CDS:1 n=1 Tax=Paraglomus occultum TaxID=144539 RepID=A0A9N9BST9_9GLOM|nr:8700_t:CDS:2 [Paraglomus occultum]